MERDRFVRAAGLMCLTGGIVVAVGAIVSATIPTSVPTTATSYPFTSEVFRFTQVLWATCHVLTFLGTLGFARSGAVGPSRLGRVGLWLALAGMALVAPLELGFIPFATVTTDSTPGMILSSAIGIATTVAGLGFVLAGIAVLRARRWHGWHRAIPLLCGLVVFVVLTPILAIRPDLFLWPIAAWSLCLALLGLALYQEYPGLPRASLSSTTA